MKWRGIMGITRWNLEQLLSDLQIRQQLVNKHLMQSPVGYLMQTHRNQKQVYFQVINEGAGRKRISINKRPELVDALARKKYLEIELGILNANIKELNTLLENYVDITPNEVLDRLPKRYQNLPEDHFLGAYDDPTGMKQEFKDWANQPYEQSTYRVWEKTHTTARGLKVRSKSEVIISEKLDGYLLPFRYEQMIYFQQYSFSPDFIILTTKGLRYWEHCGKVNDPGYMQHHKWKLRIYEKMGIVPWENLIVTYDDVHGGIDSRIIEAEIVNKLL